MFKPKIDIGGPIAVLIATTIPIGIGIAIQKATGTDPAGFYWLAALTAGVGVFLLSRRNSRVNHIRFSL